MTGLSLLPHPVLGIGDRLETLASDCFIKEEIEARIFLLNAAYTGNTPECAIGLIVGDV